MDSVTDIVLYAVIGVLGACVFMMFVFLYFWCKGQIIWKRRGYQLIDGQTRNTVEVERLENDENRELKEKLSKAQTQKERAIKEMESAVKGRTIAMEELEALRKEKEDLLNRLSRITSEKLRDGNPNIVDISDQNRPGKLGEQYSELYDNEWTDAFSVIEKEKGSRQAIEILFKILLKCYVMSKTEAESQITSVKQNLDTIITQLSKGPKSAVDAILYRVKEERKLFAPNRAPNHEAVRQSLIQNGEIDESILNKEELQKFLKECERICWLMVVQDPPMVLFYDPHHGNQDNFRAYLHRGEHLLFVVWPTVLQYEGGPLVFKGVAEFGDDEQIDQS